MRRPTPITATYAALGLGLARDTGAVELLAADVRRSSPASPAAAWALGEIRDPAARTRCERCSRRPGRTRGTSRALLIAESKIKPLDFAAVRPFLSSSDAELRWAAAYAIARQRAPAGARALMEARNPDAAFAAEVARELTRSTAGDSLRTIALACVARACSRIAIRTCALPRLARSRTYGMETRADMLRGDARPDANVRVAAAQSASSAFATESAAWRAAWTADTSTWYVARCSRPLPPRVTASADSCVACVARLVAPRGRGQCMVRSARQRDCARTLGSPARPIGRPSACGGVFRCSRRSTRCDRYASSLPCSSARSPIPTRSRAVVARVTRRPRDHRDSGPARSSRGTRKSSARSSFPRSRAHVRARRFTRSAATSSFELDASRGAAHGREFHGLTERGLLRARTFHRVVPAFVAQDGDPRGDGNGGPGYAIRDELSLLPYSRGAVGMALSGPDTGGSQYFLTLAPQPHLDGHYTVFGRS